MAQGGENETSEIKPKRPKRHRATKRALAQRDLKLIEKLAAGATIEEIAASEGISVKWARERKAAVLASRVIDTPHEFIKLQIPPPERGDARLLQRDEPRRSEGGRQGDQGRARTRPLSRVRPALARAQVRGADAGRAAAPGPAGASRGARSA